MAAPAAGKIEPTRTAMTENPREIETRRVMLSVRLPAEVATQAEELQARAPHLLDRIVLVGLTQKTIFQRLLEDDEDGS